MAQERVLVIGAGVNGSICAARLYEAGVDVRLLARGARAAALQRDGVVIEDPLKRTTSVTRVPVITELAPDDVYQWVLVVVRRDQVAALLPTLAANRSPNVVFMVNTVEVPEAWARVVGKERVLLGFVFGAGRRQGEVIHAIQPRRARVPFGELDGRISPRLRHLVALLDRAGLRAQASRSMPDWLTTHAAMVAPLGALILEHGCDTRSLAHDRKDLRTLAAALKETVAVLEATGHRVRPAGNSALAWLPGPLVRAGFKALLDSRLGEVGAGWHCSQAPGEIAELGRELGELVRRSGVRAPALMGALTGVEQRGEERRGEERRGVPSA